MGEACVGWKLPILGLGRHVAQTTMPPRQLPIFCEKLPYRIFLFKQAMLEEFALEVREPSVEKCPAISLGVALMRREQDAFDFAHLSPIPVSMASERKAPALGGGMSRGLSLNYAGNRWDVERRSERRPPRAIRHCTLGHCTLRQLLVRARVLLDHFEPALGDFVAAGVHIEPCC